MPTITIDLSGSLKRPRGVGMKIVQGRIALAPDTEALSAGDVGLKSFWDVYPRQNKGTLIFTHVTSLGGSYDNLASFISYKASIQSGVKGSITLTLHSATVTIPFIAIGE